MPTIKSYLNGFSAGMPGRNPAPSKRGKVNGWSAQTVRRHTRWLYGIDHEQLDGHGTSFTLTVADIPPTSAAFHLAIALLMQRLRDLGALRYHWVIEWTRRRRPHLHMAVYWPAHLDDDAVAALQGAVVRAWLGLSFEWGSGDLGQDTKRIYGPLGWLQYLSKHAARGVAHYQRQGKPDGWETTGKLWGHSRGWPEEDPIVLEASRQTYFRLRRMARSWRIADARKALYAARDPEARRAAGRRLRAARSMLASGERKLSEVRGVSEWGNQALLLDWTALLVEQGHPILQR